MSKASTTQAAAPGPSVLAKRLPYYEASALGRRIDEVLGFLLTLLFGVLATLLFRLFFIVKIVGKERFHEAYQKLTQPKPGEEPERLMVAWNHRTLLDSYFFVQAFFWPGCLWTWLKTGNNPLPYHAANQWNYFDTAFKRFCARHWHIIPVKRSRSGSDQKDGLVVRTLVRALHTHVLHIFPQGRRAKTDLEEIVPPPGTGAIVKLSRATVLPMWVQGMGNVQDSHVPGHQTYRLRLRLFRKITVHVGEPMRFDAVENPQEIAQSILDAITKLRPDS